MAMQEEEARKQAMLAAEQERMAQEQLAQQSQNVNLMNVAQDLYGNYQTYQDISGYFNGSGGGSVGMGARAMPVIGGALAGLAAGQYNYETDPNMTNKRNNFGTKYPDLRAHVGGTILGGVLGYFGGPAGAAVAGPVVMGAHYLAEPTTRALINFGDSWGGPGGALMMDPIGTIASGKYTAGQLLKGFFLGPFSKLIK